MARTIISGMPVVAGQERRGAASGRGATTVATDPEPTAERAPWRERFAADGPFVVLLGVTLVLCLFLLRPGHDWGDDLRSTSTRPSARARERPGRLPPEPDHGRPVRLAVVQPVHVRLGLPRAAGAVDRHLRAGTTRPSNRSRSRSTSASSPPSTCSCANGSIASAVLLILAAVVLDNLYTAWTNTVLTEFPFMFFSVLGLVVIEALHCDDRLTSMLTSRRYLAAMVGLGVLIGFTANIRNEGAILLAALAARQLAVFVAHRRAWRGSVDPAGEGVLAVPWAVAAVVGIGMRLVLPTDQGQANVLAGGLGRHNWSANDGFYRESLAELLAIKDRVHGAVLLGAPRVHPRPRHRRHGHGGLAGPAAVRLRARVSRCLPRPPVPGGPVPAQPAAVHPLLRDAGAEGHRRHVVGHPTPPPPPAPRRRPARPRHGERGGLLAHLPTRHRRAGEPRRGADVRGRRRLRPPGTDRRLLPAASVNLYTHATGITAGSSLPILLERGDWYAMAKDSDYAERALSDAEAEATGRLTKVWDNSAWGALARRPRRPRRPADRLARRGIMRAVSQGPGGDPLDDLITLLDLEADRGQHLPGRLAPTRTASGCSAARSPARRWSPRPARSTTATAWCTRCTPTSCAPATRRADPLRGRPHPRRPRASPPGASSPSSTARPIFNLQASFHIARGGPRPPGRRCRRRARPRVAPRLQARAWRRTGSGWATGTTGPGRSTSATSTGARSTATGAAAAAPAGVAAGRRRAARRPGAARLHRHLRLAT